jgi:two-component system chemotaxis response regulator CheB
MTLPRSRALVVVGASWGGLRAVADLLAGIDPTRALPIVIAQHRAADSPADAYVRSLAARTELVVREADDKDPIESGHVYVAPADYHLLVDEGHLALSLDGPVRFSRPSIDLLFETAAESYGDAVVAVVLTGANDDGCRGARAIKDAGGLVIAQDPATAERPEMPNGVIDEGIVDRVLGVPEIAALLSELGEVHA